MQARGAGEGADAVARRRRVDHLADRHHAARSIGAADDLHDEVEGRGQLIPHRGQRQVEAGREHHHLEPAEGVDRRVGMAGRQRALVARVHGPEHVEGLGPTDLADNDAVGAHAQRVPHEVADAGGADAVGGGRPGLEPHDVVVVEPELGGVLDRDDPLVGGEGGRRAR